MINRFAHGLIRAGICSILGLATEVAHADVTVENRLSVEGVGPMSVANMAGTTKTVISGDKSRTDSDMQLKSRLMRMLAHNAAGPSADIVRLDDDRIFHLNLNKKEYTETTFAQMRERLSRLSEQKDGRSADANKASTPSAIDESKCEWLPPKVEVKKTGEKAQFAGYDAERVVITASQPCKDKNTGSICEVALGLDEWLAAGFTQSAEAQKFHKAYAQKMGLDAAAAQDIAERARSMFGQYKGIWGQIATKMKGTKGYPVKTSFVLALGGEQCQNAKQAQSADSDANSGRANNPAALAGQLGNKLGSLFHRKKDDADASSAQPAGGGSAASAGGASSAPAAGGSPSAAALTPAVPPGDIALMTMTSELVSVSTAAASPDAFEIPAGFTKKETSSH